MWQKGEREGGREGKSERERERLISMSDNWHRCTHLLGVPDSVC